jgi:DNA polymerase-3 subunit alpha
LILADTYGCMVYQEQVMEIAKSLADFTPGQADGLRKAMGKKIPAELEKMRGSFLEGCKKNGISETLANKIYDQMVQFGGYGFNKSHSCAYGLVAYQTAYLKANFPLEYMTALITSEIGHNALVEGKENKLVTYLEEAEEMGIRVLPPDVQYSQSRFSIEDNAIRFGLVAIKNVGAGAAESIVSARSAGLFASLDDFCRRVDLHSVNHKVIESLIHAGAMDSLAPGKDIHLARSEFLALLKDAMDRQARVKEDLASGQGFLFSAESADPRKETVSVPPLHEHDLLKAEKDVLGFYLSGHPLLRHKESLKALSTHSISELGPAISTTVRLAGMMTQIRRMTTREGGEPWARVVLEDLTGEVTLLVFPRAYASGLSRQLAPNAIVAVSGRVSFRGEDSTPELIAEEMLPLDAAMARWSKRLTLSVSTAALEEPLLQSLRQILEKHPGHCPVVLRLENPNHHLTFVETDTPVCLEGPLLNELERALGPKTWHIESAS